MGVVVSAGVTITGVLWYQNRMPYIAGEDITACVAAAVERKWVTDWITPSYTTTVFRKASDLVLAADLMRKAITNANVIYLDPRTWDEVSGLDMAVSHTWSGLPYSIGNQEYFRSITLATPLSTFMNGIALADKVTPYSITTNIVEVLHQNLVIVSQTPTTYPDWPSTGRTNGTIFTYQINPVWGMGEYTDGNANWQPIWYNEWVSDLWSTYSISGENVWVNYSGSVTGDYSSGYYYDEGIVTIGYHNSYSPSTYTTNYVVINASTNLPLYAHGKPGDKMPDVEKIKPLIGNTNSWWAYKGFNEPYAMNQVETNGRPLYFITTNGLNQLRKLATNMVRTVDFDFPCSNNAVTWSTAASPIVQWYSNTSNDLDTVWSSAVTAMQSGVAVTNYTEVKTTLLGHITDYDASTFLLTGYMYGTNYNHFAYVGISNRRFEYTMPTIPVLAYTNGYIKRMRVYVQYEVTGPQYMTSLYNLRYYLRYVHNTPPLYTPTEGFATKTDENVADRLGWDYTFGTGTPSLDVPTNITDDISFDVSALATNRVWVLVADVNNPTTPPSFSLGPSDLVSAAYTYPEPNYGYNWDFAVQYRAKRYYTYIVHSALVIDWDFKIFGDTEYVPEAYKPAWTTNNIPPWSTNSP
jgi:hypothetical protein